MAGLDSDERVQFETMLDRLRVTPQRFLRPTEGHWSRCSHVRRRAAAGRCSTTEGALAAAAVLSRINPDTLSIARNFWSNGH